MAFLQNSFEALGLQCYTPAKLNLETPRLKTPSSEVKSSESEPAQTRCDTNLAEAGKGSSMDIITTHESLSASPKIRKVRPVKAGHVTIGGPEFAVIAGPCSIESYSQFRETALGVKQNGASLLRGGVWKMRTNASAFQGLGAEALHFISDVLKETGMGLVTEITDPRQIELLDGFISMYQVGARNMFNYALLKELGQTKKPVLLKRAFSALIDEWVKAADYITQGGNENVILCERGIRTFETKTRYTFDLNAVIWAKQNTNFPVVVDPSHAVGIRKMVSDIAYAAAAVGADGIIVEVHPRPHEALSDGPQALTLPDFAEMMSNLEKILAVFHRSVHPAPEITLSYEGHT
jgi:3-deoxy-7-phosphoheptulonate synthase